jgi:hypothetical protein
LISSRRASYQSDAKLKWNRTDLTPLPTDRTPLPDRSIYTTGPNWDANPLIRQQLGSIDNPELSLYRIVPNQVRFMREWALEYHDVPIQA